MYQVLVLTWRPLLHLASLCSWPRWRTGVSFGVIRMRSVPDRRPDRTRRLASLIVVKLQVLLVEDGIFHALLDFRASSHAVGAGHVLDASGCEPVLKISRYIAAFVLACRRDGLDEMVLGFFFILRSSVAGVVFCLRELVEGGDEVDPGPSREL